MKHNTFTNDDFIRHFDKIIKDEFGGTASNSKFIIVPNYDLNKSSTGEDEMFRMVILSEDNVGGRIIDYQTACDVLTIFPPHYPTKIVVKSRSDMTDIFEITCSTRLRKPSEIAGISSAYSPFVVDKNRDDKHDILLRK